MIFAGDYACPNIQSFPTLDIPKSLRDKKWVLNLEGSLMTEESDKLLKDHVVYNGMDAFEKLDDVLNLDVVALANNHIDDTANISQSIMLSSSKTNCFGAGENLDAARTIHTYYENDQHHCILNFGWEAIDCTIAKGNSQGVNPYSKENVIEQFTQVQSDFPESHIILYMHWNYELAEYPHPLDRELSHHLIDLGAKAVIGCHSHRVQGAEIYKDCPIIYGLVNFIFPQNVFWDGKLSYPDFCSLELCFELNVATKSYLCHWLVYDKKKNEVSYVGTESLLESKRLKERTPFSDVSLGDYELWFKENRTQKKLLPIFKFGDSKSIFQLKIKWISIRHKFILFLYNLKNIVKK